MSKRSLITHITPLPDTVTREAAIDLLHDHVYMIRLNPLVLRHSLTKPHPNATPEEVEHMTWHELTDEIQYIPGTPIKSEVSYKAGFYNIPTGLQTHSFAPGGVELQGKWTVGGNMPGERREPMEIGVDKPKDGLYLREEIILRCSIFLTSFVKKNLDKSHGVLVQRLIQSAQERQARLPRPTSFRASKSDTMLLTRSENNGVVSSPRASASALYSPQQTSPIPPRRAGTQCSCPTSKHLIACPHYSRIYQPPTLAPREPELCPASHSQMSQNLGLPSWTVTPQDNGGLRDESYRISLDLLSPILQQSAVPAISDSHRRSFDSRDQLPPDRSAPARFSMDDQRGFDQDSAGIMPSPPNPKRSEESKTKLMDERETVARARRYYEYSTQIAELE